MDRVRITDVSPRDGLQNEPLDRNGRPVATEDKARLVRSLAGCGFDEIEVSGFVLPKAIPQLADAAEVFASVSDLAGPLLSALVPNEKGMAAALEVNQRAAKALIGKVS